MARARAMKAKLMDSSGRIELHSDLLIKCSKYPPSFCKHNRNLLSKFSNTDLSISGVIPSHKFSLFYSLVFYSFI